MAQDIFVCDCERLHANNGPNRNLFLRRFVSSVPQMFASYEFMPFCVCICYSDMPHMPHFVQCKCIFLSLAVLKVMLILSWHVLDRLFYLLVYLDNNLAQGTVCYNISNEMSQKSFCEMSSIYLIFKSALHLGIYRLRFITKCYRFSEISFFSVCV